MENKKSIWLRKLGVLMFNQQDSTLSNAYRYLSRLLKNEQALLYLKEDASEEGFSVLLSRNSASVYSLMDETIPVYRDAVQKAYHNKQCEKIDDYYAIPLSSSKAAYFGFLLVKTEVLQISDELQQAIDAFGELLYAELVGGFLTSNHQPVMEVNDVCLKYDNQQERNVVGHISLKINEGELTVIMGKSGCGKTSLLNIMAGLLSPDSGEVLWKGKNICKMKEKEKNIFRKDDLGYIFQNYNLIGELTSGENVSVAAILSKNSLPVQEALQTVKLEKYENYYPKQMSGGMQQRVAIARALVKNAAILLCDEPTGALDSENGKLVMTILQQIAHNKNIPVVVVSHNPDYALLADHYILLKDGHIEDEYYNHFAFDAAEAL